MSKFHLEEFSWMTHDQQECYNFLAFIHGGANHMFGKIQSILMGKGISIESESCHNHFGTYDYSYLTFAVIAAHNMAIRFSIEPCRGGRLLLCASKRSNSDDVRENVCRFHPTMNEAIEYFNSHRLQKFINYFEGGDA